MLWAVLSVYKSVPELKPGDKAPRTNYIDLQDARTHTHTHTHILFQYIC
jgi:hypothetical protein